MIKIGTRGSKLALIQTEKVISALKLQGIDAEKVIITTKGDKVTNRGIHQVGGFGIFVRELDNAILNGEIDAAVHSMKDIPAERPSGLITAAVLPRDSPNDFLVTKKSLDEIKIIGTSSLRRKAQLLRYFNNGIDVVVKDLRGNIDTRIAKLENGEYDAIVLAEAGIERMNLTVSGFKLPIEKYIPSPNQGTIAIVSRDTPEFRDIFNTLNDSTTEQDTRFERIVMEEIGGGCFTPLGVYCKNGNITTEILSPSGNTSERITASNMNEEAAHNLGRTLREKALSIIKEADALQEEKE